MASDLSAAAGREVDSTLEDEERTSVILRLEVARHGRVLCERHPGAWVDARSRHARLCGHRALECVSAARAFVVPSPRTPRMDMLDERLLET